MNNSEPLTIDEYQKLFKILELVSLNIERLLNSGVLSESSDDEQINQSQERIDDFKKKIQKEKGVVQKLRAYLKHRKEIEQNRK